MVVFGNGYILLFCKYFLCAILLSLIWCVLIDWVTCDNTNKMAEGQVNHIAVKLPMFWTGNVAAWFAQAEASFEISGVSVPERVAAEISDVLTNPPQENKYQFLKSELIRRLSCSEEKRLNQFLSDEEIGDRSPSQFLRHLRSLAGSSLQDESILRRLWMRRLPQHVQAILTAQSDL